MHILIFTPTWLVDYHTGEEAFKPECEAAIKSQVLRDDCSFDWHVTVENPHPIGDYRNVLHQYQQAREYFLHGRWDALLTIEHDNVLPDRGAVQRLLDTPGDVVYAPYILRHGRPSLSTWQYISDRNLGMSLSMYPRQLRHARRNVIWRVCGAGFGCTLIRRHVLEQVEFSGATPRDKNHCPDLRFARDVLHAGFVSHGRFDVPVLHFSEGKWLHPFGEMSVKMNYLALQTINVFIDGTPLHLEAGTVYDLPVATGSELARAGYAQPEQLTTEMSAAETPAPIEQAVIAPAEVADAPAQAQARRRATRGGVVKAP